MFKRNLIAALIGIMLLCGFLGIMMWWLRAVPIVIIMLAVIGMMLYDVYLSLKEARASKS